MTLGATGFRAAVDDEEDDVIDKPLSVTLGRKPLAKKEQEKGRGRKEKRKEGRKEGVADLRAQEKGETNTTVRCLMDQSHQSA